MWFFFVCGADCCGWHRARSRPQRTVYGALCTPGSMGWVRACFFFCLFYSTLHTHAHSHARTHTYACTHTYANTHACNAPPRIPSLVPLSRFHCFDIFSYLVQRNHGGAIVSEYCARNDDHASDARLLHRSWDHVGPLPKAVTRSLCDDFVAECVWFVIMCLAHFICVLKSLQQTIFYL